MTPRPDREFYFSCPHCGDPGAVTEEPSVDVHSGAVYTCGSCHAKIVFSVEAVRPPASPAEAMCWHGHKERQVGCVSCVMVFDWPEAALSAQELIDAIDMTFAQSSDALGWAEAFVKHVTLRPSIATDEGTMLSWFANAIMRGWDEGRKRLIEEQAASPAEAEGRAPLRDTPITKRLRAWIEFLEKQRAACPLGWCKECAHRAATEELLADAETALKPPLPARREGQ